ncbi:ABC transporter permease [Bradyrhizobium pachyrhizi]|uniref:ABC transporter permease n=1 Tax=Bradyrhizobium TaxID=374 RepID=UPI0007049949|nr:MULTISPECIES: ABC transporter permease [Bradyrhizobium]KRQ05724.1 ABC transporter permease [Bradyrhizobium pachyrhizi]MCP1834133.1 ribose transport system permease protein [Bradyrhizobium sp. USDA 4545]MCP1918879.1 ribose transport system permease protein [Bradyrhizobium sp. USDA 4532]
MNTALVSANPQGAIGLRSIAGRVGFLPALLVLLVAGMSAIDPQFYGIINILNILRNASLLAIVACGQALVIIAGGFDLSVGAVVALASVVTAKTMAAAATAFPGNNALIIASGMAAGLGSGAVVGLVNGFCVAKLKVSGFVVTLGTMSATAGVGLMITNGIPVYGMPDIFVKGFGRAQALGLPTAVHVALVIIIVMVFAQRRTLFGRYVYAIGGNVDAAIVSGVSIQRHVVGTYVVSSMLAALTGILLTAQVGSGQASFGGDRMMLQSIAAAVIGGVSLRGGVGRIEIVAISALFLTILGNALNLLHVDSRLQPVFLGVIMVAAVALDELSRRSKARV